MTEETIFDVALRNQKQVEVLGANEIQPEQEVMAAEQVEQVEVEQQEQQLEQLVVETKPKKDHPNFASLRNKAEQMEYERNEAYRIMELERRQNEQRLESLRLELLSNGENKKQDTEEDDSEYDPDGYANNRKIQKIEKKYSKKNAEIEQKLARLEAENAVLTTRTMLRNKYNDWDSIVNNDNLAKLSREYPQLGKTLDSTNDMYAAGESAYLMIKKFGISEEPEANNYDSEKELVQKNAKKPRTIASLNLQQGESPLSKANVFSAGLTKDLEKQLWKEIQESRNKY